MDITHLEAKIQFFSLEDLKQAIQDARHNSPLYKELNALLWEVENHGPLP